MSKDDVLSECGDGEFSISSLFKTIYILTLLDENKAVIKRLRKEFESRFKDIEPNKNGVKKIHISTRYWNSYTMDYKFTGLVEHDGKALMFSPFDFKEEQQIPEKEEQLKNIEHPDKERYKTLTSTDEDCKRKVEKLDAKRKKRKHKLYMDVQDELNLPFDSMSPFHRTLVYANNGCKIRKYTKIKEKELLEACKKLQKLYAQDIPTEILTELVPDFLKGIVKEQGWNYMSTGIWEHTTYREIEDRIINKISDIFGASTHTVHSNDNSNWWKPKDMNKNVIDFEGKNHIARLRNTSNLEDRSSWSYYGSGVSEDNYITIKYNTLRQFLTQIKAELTKGNNKNAKLVLEKLGFEV